MRTGLALAILIGTTAAALADSGPVLVIPGRPGVPIIINGVDASYAVVEGDWGLGKGLARDAHGLWRPLLSIPRRNVGHYYPSAGQQPGYGRLEIEPPANRKLPQPAESYHQSWSAQSSPQRPQPEVPLYPPPVILAPQGDDGSLLQAPAGPPQDFQRVKPPKLPH